MTRRDAPVLETALEVIRQRTGIVPPPHRRYLVRSALSRAAGDRKIEKGLERLLNDEERWAALISALTVGETYFFRHFGHYQMLRELATDRHRAGRSCRVLCAGCATGEEAWSAAAVLTDIFGPNPTRVRVVGWDIDQIRIGHARRGRYRSWSVRKGLKGYDQYFHTAEQQLFREANEQIVVDDRLRSMTRFEAVNLAQRRLPSSGGLDAIFFRNVAIYWSDDQIRQVVDVLTERLVSDGLLFVGPADPVNPTGRWVKRIDHDTILLTRRGDDETDDESTGRRLRDTDGGGDTPHRRRDNSSDTNRSQRKTRRNKEREKRRKQREKKRKKRNRLQHRLTAGSRYIPGGAASGVGARLRARSRTRRRNQSNTTTGSNLNGRRAATTAADTPAGEPSSPAEANSAAGDELCENDEQNDQRMQQAQKLADRGEYARALEVLEKLIEPVPVSARRLKGVVLMNRGRAKEAAALFKQCVFLEPHERAHRQWLAVAYESLGRKEDAQREWRNFARLSGRSAGPDRDSDPRTPTP